VDILGGAVGQPVALDSLNTIMTETAPLVTADELTIIFGSDRDSPNSRGGLDIWMATRPSPSAPFGAEHVVGELATAAHDIPTWISPDGCHLYFDRYDARGRAALVAVRLP
jgi:hypothetical protein